MPMRRCAAAAVRLAGCIAAVTLAQCAAPRGMPPGPAGAPAPASTRRGSWMAAGAKKLDLLYVSDYGSDDVDAYSYPTGKLRGVLAGVLNGFVLPSGLCSDAAGDVFIPDSADSTVLEYAHGSTKLRATLLDPYELPYSCAVDPSTGNLAVVNLESASGAGGVAIYARARGRPKFYGYGFLYQFFFDAYDEKGDLFADAGYDVPSEPFAFVELPRGGKALRPITLEHSFHVAGGVAWDGSHVVVGDSKTSVIYRFAIHAGAGRLVGSTRLSRGRFVTQFFIRRGCAVGAAFEGASVISWTYPAGGAPRARIAGLREPFGVTFSAAPGERAAARCDPSPSKSRFRTRGSSAADFVPAIPAAPS